ncbi:15-hydroxyprostaglandin dehydrogenase [NAD(+)]-like [Photinus pyralis]|uniref:15-hydroxyprostaglandin dehydrogenase [NAD(+)]-like n=1 Tax=Photinus pyralis TaxID=7054 RepID=UPI0012674A7A|nr:15-hydroxyprostaglandin dehydrogenase [NAD(+)]-like [Photinus pyralis]
MVSVNETRGSKAVRLLTEEFGSGKVIWIRADVSDERELEEAFKVSTAHWGALDIVVNDAGVSDESNPVRVINVNAVGVMQGTILGFRAPNPYLEASWATIEVLDSDLIVDCPRNV